MKSMQVSNFLDKKDLIHEDTLQIVLYGENIIS